MVFLDWCNLNFPVSSVEGLGDGKYPDGVVESTWKEQMLSVLSLGTDRKGTT